MGFNTGRRPFPGPSPTSRLASPFLFPFFTMKLGVYVPYAHACFAPFMFYPPVTLCFYLQKACCFRSSPGSRPQLGMPAPAAPLPARAACTVHRRCRRAHRARVLSLHAHPPSSYFVLCRSLTFAPVSSPAHGRYEPVNQVTQASDRVQHLESLHCSVPPGL